MKQYSVAPGEQNRRQKLKDLFSVRRIRRALAWSAFGTIMASGIASVGANSENPTLPENTEIARFDRGGGNETVISHGPQSLFGDVVTWPWGLRVSDQHTDTKTVLVQGEGELVFSSEPRAEELKTDRKIQNMKWARQFDRDPQAGETINEQAQIKQVADTIEQLRQDGWEVTASIMGSASDEDDDTWRTGNPGAGLGVDSPKNVALALKRAVAGEAMLQAELQSRGIDDVALTVTGGQESRDEGLNQALVQLAAQRDESVQAMIVSYNRGYGEFSDDELVVLDALAADRYVGISIEATRTTDQSVITYREGAWHEETRQETETGIRFIVVPFIVPPIPGRRRNKAGASTFIGGRQSSHGASTSLAAARIPAYQPGRTATVSAARGMGRLGGATLTQGMVRSADYVGSPSFFRGGEVARLDLVRDSLAVAALSGVYYWPVTEGFLVSGAVVTTKTPSGRKQTEVNQLPPTKIGNAQPGYGDVPYSYIQPTSLNDGSGRRGHRKGKGGNINRSGRQS